uniref:C-type lectin domain containing 11A n=1 Tax=Cyprinus carpio carpio TaxID=630221 RepID=A0A9J7WUS2_CYPCA
NTHFTYPLPSEEPEKKNPELSRLAAMDQAIHRLNVGHYTLDIKVTQLLERMSRLENRLGDTEDAIQQVSSYCKDNRKEIGRLEGCQKGRKMGYKCFLAYRVYETYADASEKKHFLSSQPDGGKRENCVAMSSDDGDWWDTYCERRMYYLCEFDV